MNDSIQTAYDAVCAEIERLQMAKAALEKAMTGQSLNLTPKPASAGKKAPAGTLAAAILSVLKDGKPRNNSQVRKDILAKGYVYSLKPMHVGKTLAKLLAKKKVKREGKNSGAKYTLSKSR